MSAAIRYQGRALFVIDLERVNMATDVEFSENPHFVEAANALFKAQNELDLAWGETSKDLPTPGIRKAQTSIRAAINALAQGDIDRLLEKTQ